MAHLQEHELTERLAGAASKVAVGERYFHYKNPEQTYVVTGLAILESDDTVGVIYKAEYGEGVPFIRPLASFLDVVERDGEHIPRFTKIG